MNGMNSEFIDCAEKEVTFYVKRFMDSMEESKAAQIAKEIVKSIDWNNSALMHKGLSWMTKNYLIQKKMV